jgi:hypothetical protein
MNSILFRLNPGPDWDNVKFVVDVANGRPVSFQGSGIEMISSIFTSFQEEIKDEVLRVGLSTILRRQLLQESIAAPGATADFIKDLLIGFLQSIDTHGELIIVDPYFFPSKWDATYPQRIVDVLDPFLPILTDLKIVTLPKFDVALKAAVLALLAKQKSNLTITCHTSEKFHDRFWISDGRTQGIVTGTSLNGLGKRYALVDRLNSGDVQEVVSALQTEGIL